MKINRHSINSLFKLAIILSLLLNAAKSVAESNPNSDSPDTNFITIISNLNLNIPIFVTLIILLLSWYLNKNKQQKQINSIEKKQTVIISSLNQLDVINNKLNDLDKNKKEIIRQVQDSYQKVTDSKIEIIDYISKQQTNQPVNSQSNLGVYSNNNHAFSTSTTEQKEPQLDISSHNSVAVIEHIPQFVDKYNQDKKSITDEAIATVVATQASLDDKRLGKSEQLTLENTTQKKYLIVQEDSDYYLVPHAKIKIDEYNITTLESLFECINFTSEYNNFHLIQPAKVSQLNSQLWQLERKGKLEFS